MKIALLNLTLDSNYGGNLQRYALIKVLQDMGHDVVHLQMHYINHVSLIGKCKWFVNRLAKKTLMDHGAVLSWKQDQLDVDTKRCMVAKPFYNKYIPHTKEIRSKEELWAYTDFDAFVVGSDQVWRPHMAKSFGISTYFLDFLPDDYHGKRIAYGVSMGVDESEFSDNQIAELTALYEKFDSVSVRERSALQLLQNFGWMSPTAETVLDPTLLLRKEDYEKIIDENETKASEGNMFCYILDSTPEKMMEVERIAYEKNLKPYYQIGCSAIDSMSIPQWLRSFRDSDYIYTDSYHGFVFSLIFHKPAKIVFNKTRGNARFDSLMNELHFNLDDVQYNWNMIEKCIMEFRQKSFNYLKDIN